MTRLAGRSRDETAAMLFPAPDLTLLEDNAKEALIVYLKATLLEDPLLAFTGVWQ